MGCKRRKGRRRALTFIEVLVASLIASTSLAAMVSAWYFCFGISVRTDQSGIGYNIGRHAMEEVKQTGFSATAEGTKTLYYDMAGSNESATQTSVHAFKATVAVSSDLTVANSSPVQPASGALRTVSITVVVLGTGETVYQSTTYLARAGI